MPVATRFFVIRDEKDLKKVENELTKEKLPLARLMGQEIEFTFVGISKRIEEPYTLRITKAFEIVLDKIIKARIEKKYDKVDVKVHIKGTRITMIHYGVPVTLLKQLIQKDIITSYILMERRIVSGKRQLVLEFP